MRLSLLLDGLYFFKITAILALGVSLMKSVGTGSSLGLDRLATWNEVMWAISVSTEGSLALVRDCEDLREENSDFGTRACNFTEDHMWLEIAREMRDSESN
jgi:hypothetical protein